VWFGARRAAQVLHAGMHGRSALVRNRRRLEDPAIDYGGGLSKPPAEP
jgi:hypothetical protein